MQGTYPVISLSFAGVKGDSYQEIKEQILYILSKLYDKHRYLLETDLLTNRDKRFFDCTIENVSEIDMAFSLQKLAAFMQRYYKKKVIILLDEYDTPMQETYVGGYWEELVSFTGNLFNSTFKINPYAEGIPPEHIKKYGFA